MRVLFDAYWWRSGPIANRRVLHEIVRGWLEQFPDDEVILAARAADRESVAAEFGTAAAVVSTRLWPHGISVILELPFIARRTGADVTLSHNFTPAFGRSAVFIQDVLFMTNPEWFTLPERVYFALMPLSLRRADVVLSSTVSEGQRVQRYAKPRVKVEDVGLAISSSLPAEGAPPAGHRLRSDRFVLTVGRLNVRKNLAFTCHAAIDSGMFSPDFPLVVVGAADGKSETLSPGVESAIERGAIVLMGKVRDEELVWLYANANAFVFMTLGEGFGLPPLEAMAFGTPTIASDLPVMREVLSDHAVFVDPTDRGALSAAFQRLPLARDGREGRRAYARTAYSWPDTVQRIRRAITRSGP